MAELAGDEHLGEWVYCSQHMRPHTTGWCTVSARDKTPLAAKNYPDAEAECRARGFELYDDLQKK